MTRSTGVGRGVGSGGIRPGGGRRPGSRNRRSRELIAQTQQNGQTDPLKFLLSVVDDQDAPRKDRISAAAHAAPYFHARLSTLRVIPQPQVMDDDGVIELMQQLEQRIGKPSAADRALALADQAETFLESVAELSPHRQRDLLDRLVTAGQARLQELAKPQPGDVLTRPRQPVIEHEPSAQPQGTVWSDGAAKPTASRSAEREIRYERDLRTGKLVEVG